MNLDLFLSIHSQLGIMTWPLTFLSALTLMLIIERFVFTCLHTPKRHQDKQKEMYALLLKNDAQIERTLHEHKDHPSPFIHGLFILAQHRKFDKTLREEAVNIWLLKKRRQYTSGLKLLHIIGTLCPLVGLLGTVLGLIDMFKSLSGSMSISPSDLADGLAFAMSTTAAGLFIALPAIGASQFYGLWAQRALGQIESVLNHFNLYISGIVSGENDALCPCILEKDPLQELNLKTHSQ